MHKLLKVCRQQYTISAANKLADFLSDNNMQMQMSGVGSGKPKPVKTGHAIARYY
jgi:hypothetical protein